jgi:DNA-binding CsgD family transcriptional regulator
MTENAAVAIIDALYSAAAGPARWPAAITVLADYLGAMGGMLVRNAQAPERSSCVTGRMCPEISALYVREYTDNPWTRAAEPVPVGEVAVVSRLCDLRDGRHLPWYADIIEPTRTHDMAYLSLPGFTSATSVGGFAFCFSETGAQKIDAAAHRMKELSAHLQRAVWLSQQVDQARILGQRVDEMLNSSPRPALLLSAAYRVVGANPAAETLLRQAEGLSIDGSARLHASSPTDDAALHAAIARAATPADKYAEGPMAVHINRLLKAPLRLLFTPLPYDHALPAIDPDSQAVVLITVVDPQGTYDNKINSLQRFYGLTPGEARVAVLLATGIGRKRTAEHLHVSAETVKKHTAACFRKTGVGSQVGLTQVVSNLPDQNPK